MCTAATYQTKDFYFGRTLDYEFSYPSEVTVTPRNYGFHFRQAGDLERHYAIIGMAYVADGYPLYYDAVTEKGLGMAGLNFVGNAVYAQAAPERDNIAQFEFIPWVLGKCATVREARDLLGRINLTDTPFSPQLPVSQLHWLIADKEEAITVEAVAEGKLVDFLPEELRGAYRDIITPVDGDIEQLVKAADKLSAHIKCLEELKAGNNEFREAAAQTRRALEQYDLPEVQYFMDTFLDSFTLTLDELK